MMRDEDNPLEVISLRLKAIGMTQKALALELGVTPQLVSQVLKGKSSPSSEFLKSAEKALRLPAGTFATQPNSQKFAASLARMPGIEVAYLDEAIIALRDARLGLLTQTPREALRNAQGKDDTLFFDASCEKIIITALNDFNDHSAIFSEEQNDERGREFAKRICFFIDPFDRSTAFKELLKKAEELGISTVEEAFNSPANSLPGIMAPFGSISCIRDGQISFNAMMNYNSGELYVACSAMIKHGSVDRCSSAAHLAAYGDDIRFSAQSGIDFTCFLGTKGTKKRELYEKHLEMLEINGRPPGDLEDPGGPARILFLSNANTTSHKFAGILSNGEKISEWLGWLAYAAHCDDLVAFELHADQVSPVRSKILLAPPPNYSMFQTVEDGSCKLNLDRLLILDTPVFYRGAILIAHRRSLNIVSEMAALKSRPLVLNR